jgi:hypothetical protein
MSNIQGKIVEGTQLGVNEFFMAKNAAEMLHKHYPGHLWAVNVDGAFMDVRNLYLSGEWGFRLSIPAIYSSSEFDKEVMRAGGELLERYKQSRGVANEQDIHTLAVDFSGRHKPEL